MTHETRETTTPRPLHEIAWEITRTWHRVSPYAKPYLDAMFTLESIDDFYYYESAKEIVLRFLSNARTWKGKDAERITLELEKMVGIK